MPAAPESPALPVAPPQDTPAERVQTPKRPPPSPPSESSAPDPEDELKRWWKEADNARALGNFRQAAEPLERLATHETKPERAALASFSLAKLQLSALAEPQRAAQNFERALEQGLREPLAEDARARLVEAHAAARDTAEACKAATSYRVHYPSGRRLAALTLPCVLGKAPPRGTPTP